MSLLTVAPLAQGFDPDTYLREKAGGPAPFDPDAYLREKRISDMAAKTGKLESLGRGAAQGATFGFGDEAAASYGAAQKQIERMPELRGVPDAELYATAMADPGDYRSQRNAFREQDAAAQKANPKTYMAGQVGGAMLPGAIASVATGGGALATAGRILSAAGQGAAQGAGYSEAENASGLARDTSLGAGLGLAGLAAGEAVNAGAGAVRKAAGGRVSAAMARATQQAADEEAAKVATLAGRYGGEVQKGSRMTENLGRLAPSMTPAQKTAAALQRPAIQQLEQQVAGSTLQNLPGQAGAIASREAELKAAQSALPQAVAARTAELSKPQLLKDASSFAKSYAEPFIAAYAADQVGKASGLSHEQRTALDAAAGLVFSRTRAGKALATRLGRPGNQQAIFGAVETAAPKIGEVLKRAIAAASAPATEYATQ